MPQNAHIYPSLGCIYGADLPITLKETKIAGIFFIIIQVLVAAVISLQSRETVLPHKLKYFLRAPHHFCLLELNRSDVLYPQIRPIFALEGKLAQ